jgi:hypothetical protein
VLDRKIVAYDCVLTLVSAVPLAVTAIVALPVVFLIPPFVAHIGVVAAVGMLVIVVLSWTEVPAATIVFTISFAILVSDLARTVVVVVMILVVVPVMIPVSMVLVL